MKFSAVFIKAPEGYIGFVEELPGANTQGETLEEAKANLQEAIMMTSGGESRPGRGIHCRNAGSKPG